MDNINVKALDFGINDSNEFNFDNNLDNNINIHQDKKTPQKKSLDFNIEPDKKKSSAESISTVETKSNPENIIESKIFPKDDEMPELDDDIKNIELTESEGFLPNSIQPLADADIVNNYSIIDE